MGTDADRGRGTAAGAPDGPTLRVRLLGACSVGQPDGSTVTIDAPRVRALLAAVILRADGPATRRQLAYLLWPDSSEAQARTNLRHLLHTVRQTVPAIAGHLDITATTIGWDSANRSDVDVLAFEDALDRADARDTSPDDALALRQEAIAAYGGDLLDGSYDEWVLAERERLRQRLLTALQQVAIQLAAREERADAIRAGRELLRRDPLREETYAFLMRLTDAAGDRAGAVRLYHECVSVLQHELGVEPSAATVETFDAIMQAEHAPRPTPGPARLGGAPLVGRDDELAQLLRHWRAADPRRLVLITGEPGIGKSRLVEELADHCRRDGGVVATARSYPTEGELGYGAVISWLRSTGVLDELEAGTPDATVLAALFPELGPAVALPAPGTASEAAQRQRVFDAVARTLALARRPLLVVADDAHWCDEASLQLLHYLLRSDGDHPVLAVATARREEMSEAPALGALVDSLRVIDRIVEIPLDRLSRSATAELAGEIGGDRAAVTVDRLYHDSEGNPLFVVELMRAVAGGAGSGDDALPPKLQAVIDLRLRQLSPPARELLELAATVGRDVSARLLAGASALDEISLVRALDELWRRGLFRERGVDAYDFSHGKIREVSYDSMSPATRRRNHRLIGETMRHLSGADADEVSGELAHHYEHAGQPEQAVAWYVRAAARAQRRYANTEAIRLLTRARALAATTGSPALQLTVLAALCTPLSVVEGFASVSLDDVQHQALELARLLDVAVEPSLLRSVAMAALCRRDFTGAVEVATELHDEALRSGDGVLAVESEYLLGIGAFWGARMEDARVHFEAVIDGFDPALRHHHLERFGQDARIVCLSRLANVQWFLGRPDEASATCDRALALGAALEDPFSLGVALVFAALLGIDMEDTERCRRHVEAMATEWPNRAFSTARQAFTGYVDVLDGRHAAGLARIRATIEEDATDHAPAQMATHLRVLVAAYEAAGDAEGGLGAADLALRVHGTRIWEPEIRRLRASFLARTGAPAAAVSAELVRARSAASRLGLPGLLPRVEEARAAHRS